MRFQSAVEEYISLTEVLVPDLILIQELEMRKAQEAI